MRSARIVNPMALGDVLRGARLQRGLSQRELAEIMGVSQRYIVEVEQGKPTKAIERLFDYMRETDVTLHADIADE